MQVISRVQFPKTLEASDVCIKLETDKLIDFYAGNNKIILHSGSKISFNTYFNSIYEKFYTKYTSLKSLYYLLKLEGDFEICAYRETYEASEKKLIYQQTEKGCQVSDYVKVVLPELKENEQAGRMYLEITCLSLQGLFIEGLVVTDQEKQRDVSLAIISCTFKKEAYIKNTVHTILQDSFLQNKKFNIFVVDNGITLNESEFLDERVQLISNRNVGGSGGFTRGLISALEQGVYTHFLFMDDDIELDSEAIYRLFSLYEYAQQDFAVAGSMLDLYKKHILYEAGALYNTYLNEERNFQYHPFSIHLLKHNFELKKTTSLNFLLVEDKIDYGAFWFFSFSKEVVEKIGLPLPFFIKVDDIEFGVRISQNFENGIVAFPSIAVWHEPFYMKRPVWDVYYWFRNHLISNSIHGSPKYFRAVKSLTHGIIYNLLKFDYNSALMLAKSFEHYIEGPNFIRNNDPEILHSQIVQQSKSHKSQTVIASNTLNKEDYQFTKIGKFKKLLSLVTLNGHFLPKSLISEESTMIRERYIAMVKDGSQSQILRTHRHEERDSVCKAFAKKRIIFVQEPIPSSYENEIDKKAAMNILYSWIKSIIKGRLIWAKLTTEWKQSAKDLTSIEFWKYYLEHQK
ncbi:glycosyltransferase [Aetokthonos hydrillicola Thurmond2011]|jgi:galactofuranosylgalactofuranosylrhamnosyl-N-acetylglucosaminyl-diphospho-decaprenol beta-1,5/1,6-galactofuranosyltransferase|uniref:Glycosyltransferase n=1 Tax=Aetokthonos hydrillicola Thurmond2011 TaxID=2712845 RepID=A0AAP5I2P6_9CYAN|nr:glycosyltransferase [Aetokthonos hydrillicola]MBO3460910.1 glycosyltransferase family 2 protein [Aetokthonos hydrillicola CCALA 1050]MBW4586459.1 glycosyltransferase [Aetokthonos hydrillicola CCALA 1050]MDR9893596.1 glycosyltransferase [Aetokthonos hydrillicola Thurmond2011]